MALSWSWDATLGAWYVDCGIYTGPNPPDYPASVPANAAELDYAAVDWLYNATTDEPFTSWLAGAWRTADGTTAGFADSGSPIALPEDAAFALAWYELGYATDGAVPPDLTPESLIPVGYAAAAASGKAARSATDLSAAGVTLSGSTSITLSRGPEAAWFRFAVPPGGTLSLAGGADSGSVGYQGQIYTSPFADGGRLIPVGDAWSSSGGFGAGASAEQVVAGAWLYLRCQLTDLPSSPTTFSLDWSIDSPPSALTRGVSTVRIAASVPISLAVSPLTRGRTLVRLAGLGASAIAASVLTRGGARVAPIGWSGTYVLAPIVIQDPRVVAAGLLTVPDLGQNVPLDLALQLLGTLQVAPPQPEPDLFDRPTERTMQAVVLSLPTPAIVNGLPTLPAYWARSASTVSAIQGPAHIHAIPDPDPVWNPATSGWFSPPPPLAGAGEARWTVQTLPDPAGYPGGYYWLGEPSGSDGTRGITNGATSWAPDRSTPGAPSWHSFFPYKPSVRALDSYLPGGNVVHHPKGVHFNSQFIEHMWLDFGRDRPQPFTIVLAAMIASYPSPGYVHHLLDAGRNPDDVGFPRISDSDCGSPRSINDGLNYRSYLTASSSLLRMGASDAASRSVVTRFDGGIRPRMFFAVFNGSHSTLGCYSPGLRRSKPGAVDRGGAQHHRFFVLGRRQGRIAQGEASHIMIFEIRYWQRALAAAELEEQYGQLSSTYQFSQYRAL